MLNLPRVLLLNYSYEPIMVVSVKKAIILYILDKIDISNLPIYLRGEKGNSYLPQEPSIFRGMNVQDNLMSIIEIVEPEKNKHQIISKSTKQHRTHIKTRQTKNKQTKNTALQIMK